MDIALKIRQNAEEKNRIHKDLLQWEDELEKAPVKSTQVPVVEPRKPMPKERIASFDYRKWDQFDVDRALYDVDYETHVESKTANPKVRTSEELSVSALVEKEKGNAYFKREKYVKAVSCYTKSLQLDPTPTVYSNRAFAYLKLQRFKEAIADCNLAINLDPKNIKAYWRRGLAKNGLKDPLAIKDFEAALVLEPTNKEIKHEILKLRPEKQPVPATPAKKVRRRIAIEDVNKPEKESVKDAIMKVQHVELSAVKINEEIHQTVSIAAEQGEIPTLQKSAKIEYQSEQKPSRPLPILTKFTLFDFEKIWANIELNSTEPLELLSTLSRDNLSLIFKDSFEPKYLSTVIECLDKFHSSVQSSKITQVLDDLSHMPRFKMVVLLLNKDKKQALQKVLETLPTEDTGRLKVAYRIKT